MRRQENLADESIKPSRRLFFGSSDDVLTADEIISNDERDGEGIKLGCLIQTE
jgi:hypothetical protein